MRRKVLVLVMALAVMCSLLAGCKSMPDELATAIASFNTNAERITEQIDEAGTLVKKATELLTSGKPVADVTTTSKLQAAVDAAKQNVKFEIPKRPPSLNAINEKIAEMTDVDFGEYITNLKLGIRDVKNSQEEYLMNDTLVSKENGVWGVYKNGQLDTSYTGLAMNDLGTWYVKDGKVDFSYSGQYEFAGVNYVIKGGKVPA